MVQHHSDTSCPRRSGWSSTTVTQAVQEDYGTPQHAQRYVNALESFILADCPLSNVHVKSVRGPKNVRDVNVKSLYVVDYVTPCPQIQRLADTLHCFKKSNEFRS